MISAGEVGGIFTIKDEASVVLRAIAAQMNSMQGSVDKLAMSFKGLKLPPGVSTSIGKMDKAMSDAMLTAGKLEDSLADMGVAADRGAVGAVAGFGRIDAAISTTQGKLAALRKEMGGVGRGVGGGGVSGGAWTRPGGGGGSSGHSGASLPLHTNAHAGPVGMRTHEGPLIAGAVAGFSIWESLKAGADLQQVQENLKGSGVSEKEITKATRLSYEIGQKFAMTAKDVLQTINEVRNPLNKGTTADEGVEAAMAHMPALAEAAVRLKAVQHKGSDDVATDIYALVKSAEFRNAIGDKQFDHAIKSMVDADVATGGIVTPKTWLQMSQQLKGALPGLSDDYLYTIMPELAQEFGGRQAGTAGASLYQQLVSGQMRTTGLRLLDKYDKVDKSKVEYDKSGRMVKAEPGFYDDVQAFRANQQTGMAMLIQSFVDKGVTDPDKQRDIMAMVFGNRTANQMANTLSFQGGRLARGAQGIVSAQNSGVGADDLLKNNPYTQWSSFTSALTNAGSALGTSLMPAATGALNQITSGVNEFRNYLDTIAAMAGLRDNLLTHDKNQAFMGGSPHTIQGRDPRSPSVGPYAYSPASAARAYLGRDPRSPSGSGAYTPPTTPPNITANITAPLTGAATVNVTNNVNVTGLVQTIMTSVKGEIEGLFKSMAASGTNSDSGHDGRAAPSYPDHFHGAH